MLIITNYERRFEWLQQPPEAIIYTLGAQEEKRSIEKEKRNVRYKWQKKIGISQSSGGIWDSSATIQLLSRVTPPVWWSINRRFRQKKLKNKTKNYDTSCFCCL